MRGVAVALAFGTDLALTSYLLLRGGETPKAWVSFVLVLGRVLGLVFLSTLAVRLVRGRWPVPKRRRPPVDPPATQGTSLTTCEGATITASQRQTLLLEEPDPEALPPPTLQRAVTPDGDARALRIDAEVAAQQAQVMQLAKRMVWRNALLIVGYLYVTFCSMWTALLVVSGNDANILAVVANILCIVLMNLEFMLVKRLVADQTAGDPVMMTGVHSHPLYWTDVEGKGYATCSICSEKIGAKTGGYLTLQCRVCEPNRWGYGGYQMCMQCYRKNAAKTDATQDGASGAGILRGDKGPKPGVKLTVVSYMRRLMGLLPQQTIVAMLFAVCGSQVVSTYIPKAQGDCINALVKGDRSDFDVLVLHFALLVVTSALMSFAMSVAVQTLSARLQNNMAVKLFKALLNQDIAFYDNAMTGQLNSRLNNDLWSAVSPISVIINSFLANIIMLTVGLIICFQSSWRLTVLAFTFLTPLVHITSEFSKWASKLMATQYTYMADAQGAATQALTNIRTVRSFVAQDLELETYNGHMKKSFGIGIKSAWGMGGSNLLSGLVEQGASFIILYYGGHLALDNDSFQVGSIITFTYLWNRLSSSFKGLNENLNQPVKAMSAGQRIFEILDLRPDISEEGGADFPGDTQQVEVQLKDVEFTFQSRPDKRILQGVSLSLAAGHTTAVVGKSGCGKSTISKLLLRFYDPKAGSIMINSVDLLGMDVQKLRKRIGIVSQDTQLFRMTIAENITYGLRPDDFTMRDVEEAAALANADEFIRTLPEGYKTMVGEGGHDLSGGQKQRLSIARALVRRPRLLLLDEATSALDAENEAQVQKALDDLMQRMQGSCTIMVIAHRLSTIKDANNIVVLHEGRIVEQGTHDELLKVKDGRYASMIARQLAGGGTDNGGDGDASSEDTLAKDAQKQITSLLDGLPPQKRVEVLMSIMGKYKGDLAKGMGRGR